MVLAQIGNDWYSYTDDHPYFQALSLPQNFIFLIYEPILIRFGTNGPCLNGKWLKQLW